MLTFASLLVWFYIFLGYLIYPHGLNHHRHPENSQIYFSIPDLSTKLYETNIPR